MTDPPPAQWVLMVENVTRLGLIQKTTEAEYPLALTNLTFLSLCQIPGETKTG
jgi:hypothetical protein